MKSFLPFLIIILLFVSGCEKKDEITPKPVNAYIESLTINGQAAYNHSLLLNVAIDSVVVDIIFSSKINLEKFNTQNCYLDNGIGSDYTLLPTNQPNELKFKFNPTLSYATSYQLSILEGENLGIKLIDPYTFNFVTSIDLTPKFPTISDDSLLTLVQKQTFKFFWDYGHPVSGLIRERLGSNDIVTMGGSGFGVMAILVGIERGFITRQEGFERLQKIVTFLNSANTEKFHGALPHWMNGATGKVVPFSTKDNGGDLVETSFLMEGLITVQQYFKSGSEQEKNLCDSIQKLWEGVEWTWYRKNGENKLYWHWSPNYNWDINMPISGWNEALIIYILAASSPTHPIPKLVYTQGWARNGAIINGKSFYGIHLPLGEDRGGPLFFAHYSFMGLDPRNLSDPYANYWEQNTAHARINNAYCVANPKHYFGYSKDCWGLTASDIQNGYSASSPNNDLGVIAPTAALSSFPYTPDESMAALHFFYYALGNKLWGPYGFYDSFNLTNNWFASSFLAIDEGPIICMIENYRTGLLWNLFMQSGDVQAGLTKLGFTY